MAPEPCFNVGDVTSTGRGQAAHRADAGQRRSPGATLRRRRLVRELQREQLLRGDGHKWGDGARGQEAHLQGRCSSFPARWKRWCHRNLALTRVSPLGLRCGSGRRRVCRSTSPTSSSVSTPFGNKRSPQWLLPWSAQTGRPLEVPTPTLLSSLITAR